MMIQSPEFKSSK